MLRQETDFIHNAIGVDPAGCGCTDCLVGNSLPEDSPKIAELVREHLEEDREVANRCSGTIIMYKSPYAGYKMDVIGSQEAYIIDPNVSWEDSTDYPIVIHTYGCKCEQCEDCESISADREETMSNAIKEHIDNGEMLYNGTGNTLLVYRLWTDEFVVEELHVSSDFPTVSLIPYN